MSPRERWFMTSLIVFIVGQHYQLAVVAGYRITLGLVAGLFILTLLWGGRPSSWLPAVAVFPPSLALVAAVLSPIEFATAEFVKTFSLVVFACLVFSTLASSIDYRLLVGPATRTGLFISLVCVSGLSVLQAITGAGGSERFFNPWGSRQYLHPYDPLMQFTATPRAHGFFLEPSYDAFILCSVSIILLAMRYRARTVVCLLFAGLFATQSASGLLLAGFVGMLVIFRVSAGASLALVAMGTASVSWMGPYLLNRLSSVTEVGSSTNYRLLAPLKIVNDTLTTAPFGYPLGSVESVVSRYGLALGSESGTSLDNGLYVIVVYFGWAGLVALIVGGVYAGSSTLFKSSGNPVADAIPIAVFGSLLFSGAIYNPEFTITTWLVLLIYRHTRTRESELSLGDAASAPSP